MSNATRVLCVHGFVWLARRLTNRTAEDAQCPSATCQGVERSRWTPASTTAVFLKDGSEQAGRVERALQSITDLRACATRRAGHAFHHQRSDHHTNRKGARNPPPVAKCEGSHDGMGVDGQQNSWLGCFRNCTTCLTMMRDQCAAMQQCGSRELCVGVSRRERVKIWPDALHTALWEMAGPARLHSGSLQDGGSASCTVDGLQPMSRADEPCPRSVFRDGRVCVSSFCMSMSSRLAGSGLARQQRAGPTRRVQPPNP